MICYGPRLSTILAAGVAGYVLLHRVIGSVLRVAGLVMEIVLLTCAAAAAVALVAWTVRTIARRRAAAGACTSCRFRCQRPLPPSSRARPAAPRATERLRPITPWSPGARG